MKQRLWLFYHYLSISLTIGCFCIPTFAVVPQPTPAPATALSQAQLQDVLDRAHMILMDYRTLFKDLVTEESKTIEVFDKSGKRTLKRHVVSDFAVYQSQRDAKQTGEYRNVLEVDGKPVAKSVAQLEKLFERLAKDESSAKELERIRRESTRYDPGYDVYGYTFHKGVAVYKPYQKVFRYQLEGREQIQGREVLVVKFEQVGIEPAFFQVTLPSKLKPTAAHLRGRLWIDAGSAQLWGEELEHVFNSPYATKPVVRVRLKMEYIPSDLKAWLPQRIEYSLYDVSKITSGAEPEMYRLAHIVNQYGQFRRFNVAAQEGSISPSPR